MRIVHFIESSGGSARVALAMACSMAEAGHEVAFAYSPLRADARFDDDIKRANGDIKIKKIPLRREVGLHDLDGFWQICRFLKTTGPYDILHVHSSKAGAIGRLAGLFFPRLRVVYTPHAFVTMGSEGSFFYRLIEKILSHLCAAIIAVSSAERTHAVRDIKINEKKITVIPNGLTFNSRVTREQARKKMGWNSEETVVGFVGRLSCQKNPIRLVDAFSSVAYAQPSLRLAIIGDGPLLEEMKNRAVEKEIVSRVRFWDRHEARTFIPGFDVLLCSSEYEGFPLAFIEALQSGVPIVTTPVGGALESVLPGKTGFVSKDFETESLAEALRLFIRAGQETRAGMAEHAQKRGRLFTGERMTGAVLDLYRTVLIAP